MFTQKEKIVWTFILSAAVIGIMIGGFRNGIWYDPVINNENDSNFKKTAITSMTPDDNHRENTTYQSNEMVNINTANSAVLMTLPKIGPVTAERIIRYREDFGEFQSIEDLCRVKGIGPKTFERLKNRITIKEKK